MSKSILVSLLSLLLFFAGCASIPLSEDTPILREDNVEYKDINVNIDISKHKSILTLDDVMDDLEEIEYLIKTSYAGYDKSLERGLNMSQVKTNIQTRFKSRQNISNREFVKALKDEFDNKIIDTHFRLTSGDKSMWMSNHDFIYYTNTYVKKTGNTYTVCISADNGINVGSIYEGSTDNLFLYPSKGEEVYRVGAIAQDVRKSINIKTDEGSVTVPLDFELPIAIRDYIRYNEKITEDSAYISISSFLIPSATSEYRHGGNLAFEKFERAPNKCINKKNVILDLRSNGGGSMDIPVSFFDKLYLQDSNESYRKTLGKYKSALDNKENELLGSSFRLVSPAISKGVLHHCIKIFPNEKRYIKLFQREYKNQKLNPKKIYYSEIENGFQEEYCELPEKSNFKGKIFIITDRNTASASEYAILYARHLFGKDALIYTVGENSMGCIEYAGVFDYQLKNSALVLTLPRICYTSALENAKGWKGEGSGFYPDYWSSGADLLETIVMLTGDKELEKELKTLPYSLQ